jgi:ribosome-associated toxin RatA of RatAB toxin-antitoxin module
MKSINKEEQNGNLDRLQKELTGMNRDYPFEDSSILVLKKLAWNSYKLAARNPISGKKYLEEAYTACSEIIAKDDIDAFNSGIMTLRIKVQYDILCKTYNLEKTLLRFDDPNLKLTMELIDQYFQLLQEKYKIKGRKDNQIKNIELTINKVPKHISEKLELKLILDIYKKCIHKKVAKRIHYLREPSEPVLGALERLKIDPVNSYQLPLIIYTQICKYSQLQQKIIDNTGDQQLAEQTLRDLLALHTGIKSSKYSRLALKVISQFADKNNIKQP